MAFEALHLVTFPVALDLDGVSGADSFAVKIYASTRNHPKPQPVAQGTLEVQMFDGLLKDTALKSAKPRRVWSYPASRLKSFESRTMLGAGYEFTLSWGDDRPQSDRITILACWIAPDGRRLHSAPSTISVAAK